MGRKQKKNPMEREADGSLSLDPISMEPIPSHYVVRVNRQTYDARPLRQYWETQRRLQRLRRQLA
jgi:hypothetical protein